MGDLHLIAVHRNQGAGRDHRAHGQDFGSDLAGGPHRPQIWIGRAHGSVLSARPSGALASRDGVGCSSPATAEAVGAASASVEEEAAAVFVPVAAVAVPVAPISPAAASFLTAAAFLLLKSRMPAVAAP